MNGLLTLEPRPYRGPADLDSMRTLLIEGRRANTGTYYIHIGDLSWWLFYPNQAQEFSEHIFLWEGDSGLLGWALLSPDERAFDLFVHPSERGSERAASMFRWAVDNAAALARKLGQTDIRTFWVVEDDAALIELLRQHGFERRNDPMVYFTRSLAGPIPEPVLPEGYSLRHVAGEHEAQKRAAASHGAFGSRLPFESYWPRYLSFMQSPVYEAERDRVVVAPDGRFASFCIYWLDPINRVGLFEPVGTHPDFQRQGLGKALLLESLRRMQDRDMTSAIVCTNHDNPAAVRLYESVGFQATHRLWLYSKAV